MEYIRLPPQARNVGNWQLQDLEPNSIKHYSYPILQAGQDISEITPGLCLLSPSGQVFMNGHLLTHQMSTDQHNG